jgi:magnesium transporter
MPVPESITSVRTDKAWVEHLQTLHPKDAAELVRDYPIVRLRDVLRQLPDEFTADVIAELPAPVQVQLFESMRLNRVSGIVTEMFTDDAVDILGNVPAQRLKQIIESLPPKDAQEISDLLRYPADSAGGIMQAEFLAVPDHMTVGETIEHFRQKDDPTADDPVLFYIYVVDESQRLRGVLRVTDLLFKDPSLRIRDVMVKEVRAVSVHADQEQLSGLFRDYGLLVLPVVDDFQRLRGVVTTDDILHVMEEEATEDMQKMVGISHEEEVQTPWRKAVKNRLPWLYFNVATAFLAGWVVSLFESTIASYAVLAVFLPIIAGQGGNAGSQTLTIIVRGIALGQMRLSDQRAALLKEILVGLTTGLAIGIVVGAACWIWKGNPLLGVIVCLAMVGNMIAATVSGVLIPMGLRALKIDPALASQIMLTMVTDVLGFLLFLGLAALGMYYLPEAF